MKETEKLQGDHRKQP